MTSTYVSYDLPSWRHASGPLMDDPHTSTSASTSSSSSSWIACNKRILHTVELTPNLAGEPVVARGSEGVAGGAAVRDRLQAPRTHDVG